MKMFRNMFSAGLRWYDAATDQGCLGVWSMLSAANCILALLKSGLEESGSESANAWRSQRTSEFRTSQRKANKRKLLGGGSSSTLWQCNLIFCQTLGQAIGQSTFYGMLGMVHNAGRGPNAA